MCMQVVPETFPHAVYRKQCPYCRTVAPATEQTCKCGHRFEVQKTELPDLRMMRLVNRFAWTAIGLAAFTVVVISLLRLF